MSRMSRVLVALVLVAAVAAAFLWWRAGRDTPTVPVPVATAPAPAASAPAVPDTVKHPIEETPGPLAAGDVPAALAELLGRKAVASFLQTDDFARRFVATVDNLGRAHASAGLWPVHPAAGRFTVKQQDGGAVIAPDNAARYTPLVLLAESVDAKRAADLYVRMYPLLQRAYEELGYPRRHFNDRMIEVIDLLLATPEIEGPIRVQLTEVKGPIPSERPWVRYEYADPALESLPAGQKVLVRVGATNAGRLKATLSAFRREVIEREARR